MLHPASYWSNLITARLSEANMSVRALCSRARLNRGTVRSILRGNPASMDIDRIESLLHALGCQIELVRRVIAEPVPEPVQEPVQEYKLVELGDGLWIVRLVDEDDEVVWSSEIFPDEAKALNAFGSLHRNAENADDYR